MLATKAAFNTHLSIPRLLAGDSAAAIGSYSSRMVKASTCFG